jgi:hypothetical protein
MAVTFINSTAATQPGPTQKFDPGHIADSTVVGEPKRSPDKAQPKKNKKKSSGHSKRLPPVDLDVPGLLYKGHLMTYYGMGHSTVCRYIREGNFFPERDGLIGKRPFWRRETIREHLLKHGIIAAKPAGA